MKIIIVLVLFAVSFLADIFTDLRQEIPLNHIWHEILLFVLALITLIWQIRGNLKKDKHINELSNELLEKNRSYQEWQTRAKSGLNRMRDLIDEQFKSWHLSPGEKDVALLLIKGLSMKEIADLRNTHEKTVRQQATSVYKKSGVSGRQELSAFFLEDILSIPIHDS